MKKQKGTISILESIRNKMHKIEKNNNPVSEAAAEEHDDFEYIDDSSKTIIDSKQNSKAKNTTVNNPAEIAPKAPDDDFDFLSIDDDKSASNAVTPKATYSTPVSQDATLEMPSKANDLDFDLEAESETMPMASAPEPKQSSVLTPRSEDELDLEALEETDQTPLVSTSETTQTLEVLTPKPELEMPSPKPEDDLDLEAPEEDDLDLEAPEEIEQTPVTNTPAAQTLATPTPKPEDDLDLEAPEEIDDLESTLTEEKPQDDDLDLADDLEEPEEANVIQPEPAKPAIVEEKKVEAIVTEKLDDIYDIDDLEDIEDLEDDPITAAAEPETDTDLDNDDDLDIDLEEDEPKAPVAANASQEMEEDDIGDEELDPKPIEPSKPIAQAIPELVSAPISAPISQATETITNNLNDKPSMISDDIAKKTTDSIKELIQSIPKKQQFLQSPAPAFRSGETIEDMVSAMLTPKLEQWINENLPSMVEKVVRDEIKKLIPRDE